MEVMVRNKYHEPFNGALILILNKLQKKKNPSSKRRAWTATMTTETTTTTTQTVLCPVPTSGSPTSSPLDTPTSAGVVTSSVFRPGFNFSNIIRAAFHNKLLCAAFLLLEFGFEMFWQNNIRAKTSCKMLDKLTTVEMSTKWNVARVEMSSTKRVEKSTLTPSRF